MHFEESPSPWGDFLLFTVMVSIFFAVFWFNNEILWTPTTEQSCSEHGLVWVNNDCTDLKMR